MTRYAHIADDQIINVIIWDGEERYEAEGELLAVPDDSPLGIGWTRVDGEWFAPPTVVYDLP